MPQQELEKNIQTYDTLKLSVLLAFERTNFTPVNIDSIVKDVLNKYPIEYEKIIEAIKRGSLGDYGRTFKMSTQEICIWIGQYLKDELKKDEYVSCLTEEERTKW